MISFYKRLAEIIEIQLRSKENALRCILHYFKKSLVRRYSQTSAMYHQKRCTRDEVRQKRLLIREEIKTFLEIFITCLILYYQLQNLASVEKGSLLNRDNLWNFLVTLLFDDSVHDTVFQIQKIVDQNECDILAKKMPHLRHKQPEELDVRASYCLNRHTIEHLNKKYGAARSEAGVAPGSPIFEYEALAPSEQGSSSHGGSLEEHKKRKKSSCDVSAAASSQ